MSRRSRLLPICMTEPSQVRVEPIKKSILFLDDVPTPRPVGRYMSTSYPHLVTLVILR